jgi:hypothetical protein
MAHKKSADELAALLHENRRLRQAVACQLASQGAGSAFQLREIACECGIDTTDKALKIMHQWAEDNFRRQKKLVGQA